MIRKIKMYYKYYLAWFELKHYIAKVYCNVTDLKLIDEYHDILNYMQAVEYTLNKKED